MHLVTLAPSECHGDRLDKVDAQSSLCGVTAQTRRGEALGTGGGRATPRMTNESTNLDCSQSS